MPDELTDEHVEQLEEIFDNLPEQWTFEDVLPADADDDLIHALVVFVDLDYAQAVGMRGKRSVYELTEQGEALL